MDIEMTSQNDEDFEDDVVIPDPHTVYYDAVMHSPWNHDGGGHLPEKDDWSTYRYTVKDIILGIVTHRFNKNSRRLEIRAYFAGEHRIFQEFGASKALLTVLLCQGYQSGGSLEIYFEQGIPFDIIELIEKLKSDGKIDQTISLSGHDRLINSTVGQQLFAALSEFPPEFQKKIELQEVNLDRVCFNTYRGTWSTNHIKSLIRNGIPLRWLFKEKPNPISMAILYSHLNNHLAAVLLEEYAIRRLEDRQIGESLGNPVSRVDDAFATYSSSINLQINDGETLINIASGTNFALIPVISRDSDSILENINQTIRRCEKLSNAILPVVVVSMDFIYLSEEEQQNYRSSLASRGIQLIVVGLTFNQLISEAELNLAITSSQSDPDDVDTIHVDKYPD